MRRWLRTATSFRIWRDFKYSVQGGEGMKITIKDIARECGVSISAVSMALSDKPNRISESTRRKVIEAAEKLNYQPNRAAISLANRKSKMIGIVVNDLRNTHIASLFMAINQEIEARGYSMICHVMEEGEKNSNSKLINLIASENVDALIWAKSLETNQEDIGMLRRNMEMLDIPVLTMEEYGLNCPGLDICFDYQQGAYLATKHLIEYGHRRIGCLTGEVSYKVTQDRINGYSQALEEFGIPFEEKFLYYGDYTMQSGYKALSYLLGQKVSAIFAFNDEMAFGLYRGARNYGIHIPLDLSIIGFDDVPFADVMEVPLSTIRVPIEDMGRFIGGEVVELLVQGEMPPRTKITYKPDLLLRASTMKITI